jgi:Fe-S-cluster containining protein
MQDEWVNGKAQLSVGGEPFEINFTVPAKPVRLGRMLPVFQRLSDTFNDAGIAGLQKEGKSISCKAGCGACCRQLVPVSEAEAFDLRRVVDGLPEPRRTEIRKRFAGGLEKLKNVRFFERLADAAENDRDHYSGMLREYFTYSIACPFLENESCSIHHDRPVACREYLVTSPAENCNSAEGEGIENIHYLFKVKDTVITIARNKRPPELPYVPMVQLLEWTEKRSDASPKRTGGEWMRLFLGELLEISRTAEQGPPG